MKRLISFQPFLFAALLLFPMGLLAQKTPQRVEPPFWWSGMAHAELQVMAYGENIGQTRVEIDYPGVEIKEVVAVESPNYLFLYLDIQDADPGTFTISFYDGRRLQYAYEYELRAREQGSAMREGFNTSDAIYLLMPDRFASATAANDQLPDMLEGADRDDPNARHGGDIQGIINNLDYFDDMGFTALWINPLLENNQPRYSYHGYAITDFYNIDPRFGTNDDYRRLVQEAGERGIKVIKDVIFNHMGHHHWWMDDLPANDWIHQWEEFTRTTYRMTTIVDPHAAQDDYQLMMEGWFDTNMPDLNQDNRLLATYLMQNSVWWVEFAGLSGFRVDTQPYADRFFISDWGKYVMTEYPNFNIVGEAWTGLPAMLSYFQGGKVNPDGYDSNLPAVFDFSLYDAIGLAFEEEQGWDTGMMRIYNSLAQDFLYADPYNLVVFGDNHDTDRFLTRIAGDVDKLKLALALVFTTRGIPSVYTGTELLFEAYEHDGHGIMRRDFPGGWPGDAVNVFTGQGLTAGQSQMKDYITRLLTWRQQKQVLHNGQLIHFVPDDNVYVYFRVNDQESVMVILNNNDEEKALDMSRFSDQTAGFSRARDVITQKVHQDFDRWTLPANAALVLELE